MFPKHQRKRRSSVRPRRKELLRWEISAHVIVSLVLLTMLFWTFAHLPPSLAQLRYLGLLTFFWIVLALDIFTMPTEAFDNEVPLPTDFWEKQRMQWKREVRYIVILATLAGLWWLVSGLETL